VIDHIRERHTGRLDAASLVIEPEIGLAGNILNDGRVGKNGSNSTVVRDVLSTRAMRAQRNEYEKNRAKGDWP